MMGTPSVGEVAIPGSGDWLLVTYRPVTLFSLRMSVATSSGGKTLLVPTPYAFKLAAVDAAFRADDEGLAQEVLGWVKGLDVRFRPPRHATVNHTFVKIRRQPKEPTPEEPYISSIAFREFCFFHGELTVALQTEGLTQADVRRLAWVLAHINYFGKRGSFFQFVAVRRVPELPPGFTSPVPGDLPSIEGYAVTQFLDDLDEVDATDLFERISTYSLKSVGKHRTLRPYLLPYRAVCSSKSYTYYQRVAGEED